jgi:hypothetical protein
LQPFEPDEQWPLPTIQGSGLDGNLKHGVILQTWLMASPAAIRRERGSSMAAIETAVFAASPLLNAIQKGR